MITPGNDTRQRTLRDRVQAVQERLRDFGITPVDMSRSGSLEVDFGMMQPLEDVSGVAASLALERLEDEPRIVARPIARRNESQFRWFLDGAQKTLPVWRIGIVPVIAGIAVVGIVERDGEGICDLVPESIVERVTWFLPTHTNQPDLNRVVDVLQEAGEDVRDPLEFCAKEDMGTYHALAGNYSRLLYHAQEIAGKVRAALEQEVVRFWDNRIRATDENAWIVIDGRLSGQYPNAIGFVKDPSSQHLFGEEATTLYSLPHGYRTTAYQLARAKGEEDEAELRNQAFTMWYQRMWPADGLDARHALVRLEASNTLLDSEEIDEIATWLMAERVPRPTKDGRWPTLLYPVHHLELLLKRRINAMTVGWPS